ncbi:BsuPI-related putative proteinase inhibitor [Salisediminibacterium selenitireducens]|uniref:Intracellular proteinase inhibitor BsuPI domain-containing protein n=1 Tax=Bacillus selenitireducens (strain ATCC 700615 / DSM 15326 / MLS10) TaxID=439292 RepID=D6XT90_BACIE|nr:BsuPI-related putative proteinase inhibitor [Salisediminibacterium selenitireducens]ADH99026.1 hypothetical protein Bsel_1514 [[Bacillus] selenitireducens MLS10]
MKRAVLSLAGTMLVLVGCGTEQTDEQTGEDHMNGEDVTAEVEANGENGDLHILITLNNQSSETVDLTFRSGHQFDVRIYDEDDEKLYDFAEGMMFTEALIEEQIGAGDSLTFEDVWESYSGDYGPLLIETEVLADEFELKAETVYP